MSASTAPAPAVIQKNSRRLIFVHSSGGPGRIGDHTDASGRASLAGAVSPVCASELKGAWSAPVTLRRLAKSGFRILEERQRTEILIGRGEVLDYHRRNPSSGASGVPQADPARCRPSSVELLVRQYNVRPPRRNSVAAGSACDKAGEAVEPLRQVCGECRYTELFADLPRAPYSA